MQDLLELELGLPLESFATGRDEGIDLRYATPAKDAAIVIQCKHFADSTFSSLKSHLRKEVPKVHTIDPKAYRLATSRRLTPANKVTIKGLFAPYIKRPSWIYGADDLNRLLRKYPEVEKRHFKLWLTSEPILQLVLNNDIFVRTKGFEERTERKLRLYVPNQSFPDALKLLDEQHVCIVAGVPGIGKTMLAEMLTVRHLDDGYEAVVVSDDINEALEVYGADRKQFFYYDDFLGQTSSLEKMAKNEDARLLDFIEQIRTARDKRLVLTTREYVLAQAKLRYERLDRANLDVAKCVIDLADYTRLQRGHILYNHLFFSGLSQEHKLAFLKDDQYLLVVDHDNYSPRIIETVTNMATHRDVPPEKFPVFMLQSLDDPREIWRHAFENQLAPEDQLVLLLLASMPPFVRLDLLASSFREVCFGRLGIKVNPVTLKNCLRTLEGTFITIDAYRTERIVSFHNPSVRDFLLGYIDADAQEYFGLLDHAQFFDKPSCLGATPARSASRARLAPAKPMPEWSLP